MAALSFQAHTWKFISAALLLAAAATDRWVCLGPPWLKHGVITTLTVVFSLTAYLVAWRLVGVGTPPLQALGWAGGLTATSFSAYLWLFLAYTVSLQDHCNRDVIGWEFTPAAKAHLKREPGLTVEELLEDAGRQVEVVYTGESLRTMRFVLTGMWLLSFGCLAAFLALLTVRAEADPTRSSLKASREIPARDSIFVSYRRFDSQDVVGRLYDSLTAHFGRGRAFKDVDSIPLGVSFPGHLQECLHKAKVVLVVIGPSWLTASDPKGSRRLDDPNDFVRVEIQTALQLGLMIIPVIVSNATMPTPEDLPEAIKDLAFRNGVAVRPDPDFHRDVDRLLSRLMEVLRA